MDINVTGVLLSAESKPYNVDGNSGTSHKLRFNIGGEIYVVKSTAEQVAELQAYVKKELDLALRVESRRESLSLKLVSYGS